MKASPGRVRVSVTRILFVDIVYVIMKSVNLFAEMCSPCFLVVVIFLCLICHNMILFTAKKKYKFITRNVSSLIFFI